MHQPAHPRVTRRTSIVSTETSSPQFPASTALEARTELLLSEERPRLRRLWLYYRNPLTCSGVRSEEDSNLSARPYRQAQEWGLPARITGVQPGGEPLTPALASETPRKEIVIENDIGWRIETMVDYLFGKAIVITSGAPDPSRRVTIGELLRLILAHNGGILFLQQIALLGSVYGFVDVLVKLEPEGGAGVDASSKGREPFSASASTHCGVQQLGQPPARLHKSFPDGAGPSAGSSANDANASALSDDLPQAAPASDEDAVTGTDASESNPGASHPSPEVMPADESNATAFDATHLARLARRIRLEVVEPARALPFMSSTDYRVVTAFAQCFDVTGEKETGHRKLETVHQLSWFERLILRTASPAYRSATHRRSALRADDANTTRIVEIITPNHWRRYENGVITAEGDNSLGEIPLVHIQNTAVPFEYSGASDVEPLMPLQDELNTRLSDRAHRITMQSFRMYLGKGIEDFTALPVSPGRMWMTENEQAEIVEFGGDASCPSEDAHIAELREALDKASGVSPIAAGAIKGRIGRLTSAAALRVTMQALLAKTEKKRTTYGTGIAGMCALALAWLDRAGLFPTTAEERQIELNWPSPLPENELEKLQEAEAKVRLGISPEIILRELGY